MVASIYKRKDELIFVSHARTKSGWDVMSDKIVKVATSENYQVSIKTLSSLLVNILNEYEIEIDMPKNPSNSLSNLLSCMSVRSYTQFVKYSDLVQVSYDEIQYEIMPSIRSSNFKGFESFNGIVEEYSQEQFNSGLLMQRVLVLFEDMHNFHNSKIT